MLLLVCICISLLLVVPVTVAVFERFLGRNGALQLEFWSFARSVGARCHLPVGRARTPLIVKRTPDGYFRLSARQNIFGRWSLEARAYFDFSFGFAGRLCSPEAEPLRWRTPGMKSVNLFTEEDEFLTGFSLESSSESLLRWVLRHPDVRACLEGLSSAAGSEVVEVLLANQFVSFRYTCAKGWRAGDSIEHVGSALFSALQVLARQLGNLAEAIDDVDATEVGRCDVCSQALGADPYICTSCQVLSHRGCREMVGGCHNGHCLQCMDFMPELNTLDSVGDHEHVA